LIAVKPRQIVQRTCHIRMIGAKRLFVDRQRARETRPEVVALARRLRRGRPKGGRLSLRGVSKALAAQGFLNERGKPYAAKSVAGMLRRLQ
jgi:hypothetical protein